MHQSRSIYAVLLLGTFVLGGLGGPMWHAVDVLLEAHYDLHAAHPHHHVHGPEATDEAGYEPIHAERDCTLCEVVLSVLIAPAPSHGIPAPAHQITSASNTSAPFLFVGLAPIRAPPHSA